MRENAGRLGLNEYYLIAGFNAYGTTLFFLGVFFHARLLHGFSDTANLLLAATQGCAYVAATRAGGRFADRVGSSRSLSIGLAGMCLALVFGWRMTQGWALFAALAVYSAATALTWPAIEAAIAHAPGKAPLARRTGLFNVTWSFVGSTGFFAGGALFAFDPDAVFWAPLAAHALEIAWIAARTDGLRKAPLPDNSRTGRVDMPFPQTEPAKGRRGAGAPGGAENILSPDARERFLTSAWIANGLSYFLYGAFAALSPTLGERLGFGPRLTIWLVSTYLFTRSASFVLFWRWEGWEYSRGWLAASLVLPPGAFAALFLVPAPGAAIGALAVLGAMSGLAYSASLHASLDRAGGKGEGGGLHESVIGLGILLGPLAGTAGVGLLNGIAGAGSLVTVLGAAVALAGLAPIFLRYRYGR